MKDNPSSRFVRRPRLEHWQIISFLLVIYDTISVNLSFFAALWLRFDCRFSGIPMVYLESWQSFTLFYTMLCLLVFWLGLWISISLCRLWIREIIVPWGRRLILTPKED